MAWRYLLHFFLLDQIEGQNRQTPFPNPQSHRRLFFSPPAPPTQQPLQGYGQPQDSCGSGDLSGLLSGVTLTLLDKQFIALGYVRQNLVDDLCTKATEQVVCEANQRGNEELTNTRDNIRNMIEDRCEGLIGEAETVCDGILEMIGERFEGLQEEIQIEGEKQCNTTKELTIEMVRKGAESAYNSSKEIALKLGEAEFGRQVEKEKNRGERMFQEEVEKGRAEAEEELKRRVAEGRIEGEKEFEKEVAKGKIEAERIYQETIQEERKKAEKILQDKVKEEVEKAEVLFAQKVKEGREEAERIFEERAIEGEEEGERICTEMITVACNNATTDSQSDFFCEEFFFYIQPLEDERRRKRQNRRLYGSFYRKFHFH